MVQGLYSNYIENFANHNDDLDIIEEETDIDEQSDIDQEIDDEQDIDDEQENKLNSNRNNFQDSIPRIPNDSNQITNNNLDIFTEEEENNELVEQELSDQNNDDRIEEGFTQGKKIIYTKHKLLLKSILFGILFYLLSSQKIYKITKPYLKTLDPTLIHTLLFIGLHYFLNIVFE